MGATVGMAERRSGFSKSISKTIAVAGATYGDLEIEKVSNDVVFVG